MPPFLFQTIIESERFLTLSIRVSSIGDEIITHLLGAFGGSVGLIANHEGDKTKK